MKKLAVVLVMCLVALVMVGCSEGFMSQGELLNVEKNPEVSMVLSYTDSSNVTKSFTLVFELQYKKAPITVTNFVNLVQEGFYNDTIIHTSSASLNSNSDIYYIAGGVYKYVTNEETSKSVLTAQKKDYTIKGEFESNGWGENDLTHLIGNLVMNRTSGTTGFDSASTGFYICTSDYNKRDGNYAVFGTFKSMSGKIGDTEIPSQESMISTFFTDMRSLRNSSTVTDADGNSLKIPSYTITVTMTVDTFGVTYPTAKHI